ncbi:hypothetical protein LCGC14_0018000 [marine sediment metagenome]|uniref:CoA activase n=1 Tax=marine sediment metagenome TaxID=412755 RepID=A0A0F9W4S5_9ZZZZ|nr:hypothetical protein [Phycisphaerae bacterium]
MTGYVGIDIGAVSATAALIVDAGDAAVRPGDLQPIDMAGDGAGPGGRLYLARYRRTRGKPLAAATDLLDEIVDAIGADNIRGVCLTGSGSQAVAGKLHAHVINEFKAVAVGLSAIGVHVRTVFEMGGESSKYLRLAPTDGGDLSIVDYATNGDCAAGTGSFIDQQCGRLHYDVANIGEVVGSADRAAQVAGRCSVFAKSDMVHAQQKGYTPPEVLWGLCNAVARNFRTAVVRSHPVEPPVVFIGGVAANSAVVGAIRETFDLDDTQLIVPPASAHLPAIGAAVVASRERADTALGHIDDLRRASDSNGETFPTSPPLSMDRTVLLRDKVAQYERVDDGDPIDGYLGVDIGSVSTNVVVIDTGGRVISEIYTETKGRPIEVVAEALRQIEDQWAGRLTIRGAGTTGSGRELIGELIGADTINDEITAHKTGATYVGQTLLDGQLPDTIFEIGGQDSKYIRLDDGVVVDFTMNEACAAGTGSFLEERAEELDIAIKGEFAELALSSSAPIRLGERCTVFMERDVNSYLQRGAAKADLVAGLAYSVVYNYINRVVRGRKIGDCIFFQGGTAYNDAVAAAFAAVTGKQIIVPPHNGVIGAIGVALLARDKMSAERTRRTRSLDEIEAAVEGRYVAEGAPEDESAEPATSSFRGYDLSKVHYTLREFICKGCSNACQIQEFDVEGNKTYWGDKCSDRYRKRAKTAHKPVIDDLFALREQWMFDESHLPPPDPGAPRVGIPLTMFSWEQLPFWRTLLAEMGFATVLSEPTNKKVIQAGLDSVVAEPCFPIIVAHGHVANLQDKDVDHILLPNIISMETPETDNNAFLCPWHQTLPFVCRRAPALRDPGLRLLSPQVHFDEGPKAVARELQEFFKPLRIPGRRVAAAVEAAYRAQNAFIQRLVDAGQQAMARLDETGETGIVFVGRPYNIHDAGVNLSVARKLRDNYGVNCLPMECLEIAGIDIQDINTNMYWELGRRLIAVAKLVGRHPHLHIIYITNFKCGPDSFLKQFVAAASGKPFLTLQFDGHSNDAGIMTRCEAYLDSKGVLRPWRREPAPQTV